jgi:hypothetical protein
MRQTADVECQWSEAVRLSLKAMRARRERQGSP